MEVHDLDRAELGHQRMPQYYSGGTIPKCDIKPDAMNDLIAARLARLQACDPWSSEKAYHRESLERLCEAHGYLGLWVDPRDYLVHRVGQSFLYDVPIDKRGNLAPFAGKRVRVVCLHSGAFRRHVRIGAVGEAQTRKTQRAKKADKPKNLRPPRPRLLGQDELVSTPHLLARFTGVWTRMGHRYAHGLRLQAAVWYARRFREWTGSWPQGTHEFIIKYGPTDEFEIRAPCGGKEGYCEIRLHFEARPAGAAFVEGDAEVGFNWFAMPIDDLLEGVN